MRVYAIAILAGAFSMSAVGPALVAVKFTYLDRLLRKSRPHSRH